MRKRKKKPAAGTVTKASPNEEKARKAVEKEEQNFEDGRMDFGGLPDRDLKKNLGGCG